MTGNAPQVVYYAMGVLLVLSSLLVVRLPLGRALKMGLAWVGIFAGFITGQLASSRQRRKCPRL